MENIRILIVDNDGDFRRQMIWTLKEEDYQLFEAKNRKNALKYLEREKRPSVMLLGLHLQPRLDFVDEGLKVLEVFKEKASEVKVIIVTANTEEETISRARQLGADEYIVKPFKISFLKNTIKKVISKPIPLGVERRRYWRDKDGKPVGIERRRYWRVECELPISYSLIKAKLPISGRSKTINISKDGVVFSVDQLITAHSLLDLELSLQAGPIVRALGEVKWGEKTDGIYHIGVQFLEIADEDKHKIANYIYR